MRDWVGVVSNYSIGLFRYDILLAITTLRGKPGRNSSPKQSHSAVLHKPETLSWAASKRPIYLGEEKDCKKVGTDQGGQTLGVHTIYIGKPKFPVARITG